MTGPRTIRSLGVEAPERRISSAMKRVRPHQTGPTGHALQRLLGRHGTDFPEETNPYLHSRWDGERGVFVQGEPGVRYPVPFLGYMEVARVGESPAPPTFTPSRLLLDLWAQVGPRADPRHELLVPLPDDIDPMLGIFVAQMGPIAANGILHADAEMFGTQVRQLGEGVAGRQVIVFGGGTVGLLTALFARRGGAEVVVAEPSAFRRRKAEELGLTAMTEDDAWQHAKARWRHGGRSRRRRRVPDPRSLREPAYGASFAKTSGHRCRSRLLSRRRGAGTPWRRVSPQWADPALRADRTGAAGPCLPLGSSQAGDRDDRPSAAGWRGDPTGDDHSCGAARRCSAVPVEV